MGTLQQELADHGLVSDPHDRCTWDLTVKGTGKKKYSTREEALAFAKRHEAKNGPQYAYLCTAPVTPDNPAHWHLTWLDDRLHGRSHFQIAKLKKERDRVAKELSGMDDALAAAANVQSVAA